MMNSPLIKLTTNRSKIAFFILMVLFGYLVATLAALGFSRLIGYDNILLRLTSVRLTDPQTLDLLRIFQLFIHFGLFLLGPGLYLLLVETKPTRWLGLHENPLRVDFLLIILLMFVALPGINFTHTLNEALHLPGWLKGTEQWMQEKEETAKQLTDAFLQMRSYSDLGLNLLMFGLLPALGEELFFRGVLFKIIRDWSGRTHLTIFLTSFLFSAIHLQFYGFLPRFLLGMGFGYLFIFTRTLWAPILAHFLNNSTAVVVAFYYYQGKSSVSQDDFGTVNNLTVNLISLLVTFSIFRLIYLKNKLD